MQIIVSETTKLRYLPLAWKSLEENRGLEMNLVIRVILFGAENSIDTGLKVMVAAQGNLNRLA
jgi:hypothetical protein